jgi:plastocyanin
MRKILVLAVLVGVLIPAADAKTAATTAVSIKQGGFVPKNIAVNAGDTVKWTNGDTQNHQVACAKCSFTSPVLKPGDSYSYTFETAGKFAIADALTNSKSTVSVAPAGLSVSLDAAPHSVRFLGTTTLSGAASSTQPGQSATLLGQACNESTFTTVGSTKTGASGAFSFDQTPAMNTAYEVKVTTATSTPVTVKVAPTVRLGKVSRHHFRV